MSDRGIVVTLPVALLPEEVQSALDAGVLVATMECDPSAAVGDRVRQDPLIDNKVLVAVDNLVKEPVIGVVKQKISPTVVRVSLRGVIDTPGLPRGRIYLGTDGNYSNTPPSDPGGYIQTLGWSFGNGKMNLEPNPIVTLKT